MNLKAILTFLVSLAFFWGANQWYHNKFPNLCCATKAVKATPAVVPPIKKEVKKDPLLFKWNDASTITYDGFSALKSSILSGDKKGKILQITGRYFDGEHVANGSPHKDLGIARAHAIWKTHFASIPEERVEFLSKKVAERDGVRMEEFVSADFNWINATASTVEDLPDGVIVRFPSAASQKTVDPEVDQRLQQIAQRLLANPSERVVITGHTDSQGSAASNVRLSDRRAQRVRDILIRHGVPVSRIATEAKGETQPVDTNDTARGRAANRRAEVRVVS